MANAGIIYFRHAHFSISHAFRCACPQNMLVPFPMLSRRNSVRTGPTQCSGACRAQPKQMYSQLHYCTICSRHNLLYFSMLTFETD